MRSAAKYRMMSTGDAGGGAEIEYPRGSHHDVYRRSCQQAQMGNRIRRPDRGYAIAVPLYKKVSHGVSWERKRDIAKSRDHVIKASLADKHPSGEVSRYDWHATYHYTIDGKERQYTAYFKHPSTPPLYLYLYYVDDPDKLFSCEEYHYENHKGLLLLPVIFLPGSWPASPSSSWRRPVGILKVISAF